MPTTAAVGRPPAGCTRPGAPCAASPWRCVPRSPPAPTGHRCENVEDQPARSAAGVDLLADREQRGLPRREIALDQRAQVHHAAGETVQRLRAVSGVDDDVDQVQLVQFGVGLQLGPLGIETHPAVGLLVGQDSQDRWSWSA